VTKISQFEGKSGSSFAMGLCYDVLYNVSINAEWQSLKVLMGSEAHLLKGLKSLMLIYIL